MEATEPLTIDKQIENIVGLKKLIDDDISNDYFLFPFMAMVLNLTDKVGFVTDLGIKILFNEIEKDFEIINKNHKNSKSKASQEAITRISVYFTTCYNLTLYFGGFVVGLDTEEGKKFAEKLPSELIEYLKIIMERSDKLFPILENQLKVITTKLTDEYAKIYNEAKRSAWTKDIFQTTVHIPAHPDDYPKGYKESNAFKV
jgi:hypothetical protein